MKFFDFSANHFYRKSNWNGPNVSMNDYTQVESGGGEFPEISLRAIQKSLLE